MLRFAFIVLEERTISMIIQSIQIFF